MSGGGVSLSLFCFLSFPCFYGIIDARSYNKRKQKQKAQKVVTSTRNAIEQREAEKAMNEQAAAARRAYKRAWAAANPDKVKLQQERYWERKAAQATQAEAQPTKPPQEVQPS